MRFVAKKLVLLALAAIWQISCGGRTLGGNDNTASADGTTSADGSVVQSDGCTDNCAGEPVSLAYEPNTAVFVAVDSTHVYWSNFVGEVKKVSLAGGAVTLLYDGDLWVDSIALDSTYIYWNDSSAGILMKVPKAGGTALEVASGYAQFEGPVVLDTTHVYWIQNITSDSDKLLKAPLDGGAPTVVSEVTDSINGFAIDASHAYLLLRYSGTIVKVPLEGGATEELVSGEVNPGVLAVDSYRLYWFGENGSVVKSAPLAGGAPSLLAESELVNLGNSSNATLLSLAIDGTHLYWTSNGSATGGDKIGTVSKVPLDGGSPTVLATVDDWPYDLAVDATHVYWTNFSTGGYLMKVPK